MSFRQRSWLEYAAAPKQNRCPIPPAAVAPQDQKESIRNGRKSVGVLFVLDCCVGPPVSAPALRFVWMSRGYCIVPAASPPIQILLKDYSSSNASIFYFRLYLRPPLVAILHLHQPHRWFASKKGWQYHSCNSFHPVDCGHALTCCPFYYNQRKVPKGTDR